MTPVRVRPLLASAALACVFLVAAGCTPTTAQESPSSAPPSGPTTPPPPPPPQDIELTLVAAGDVLPHVSVTESATGPSGIDYSPLLAGIDPWVDGADLALCHLEVPIAPPGTEPTGYPMFRAPAELVRDLGEQGWDGCSTASNHSVDAGYDGLAATLGALDEAKMGHVGTARDEQESLGAQYYELHRSDRTITIAHLSATYGLNGLTAPRGDWSVDLIDAQRIVQQAKAARAAGADLVVVSLHDGVEYVTEPTEHQQETAHALAQSGQVDLVIGHHAHVPQKLVRLSGGPGNDGMWTAYGLGNLLSNQGPECCVLASAVGLLLVADIKQPPGAPARVTGVRWAATTVDLAAAHRLRSTREALAHPDQGTLTVAELEERLQIAKDAAGDAAEEQLEPPRPTGEPPRVIPRGSEPPASESPTPG
ncbi:CapA family protein [Promicromonospora sp. Populi]|uniref:CapA family protein n=1 Tax=Promicromonospora sp. Populi TaxID=3239420 RepID=UPI0034E1F602